MNDKKQIQVEREIDSLRPGKGDGPDMTQGEPLIPTEVVQGFVYYEE